jgi:hypothetical protein
MEHELDFLKPLVLDMFPTGSRVICNPPVLDTDEDWVVLCDSRSLLHYVLVEHGYSKTSKKYYRVSSKITTYRHEKNNFNLIVTDVKDMFDRWREATEIATQENLTNKEDRIKLFELITGRNTHRDKPKTHTIYRYVSTGPQSTTSQWSWFGTTTTSTDLFG